MRVCNDYDDDNGEAPHAQLVTCDMIRKRRATAASPVRGSRESKYLTVGADCAISAGLQRSRRHRFELDLSHLSGDSVQATPALRCPAGGKLQFIGPTCSFTFAYILCMLPALQALYVCMYNIYNIDCWFYVRFMFVKFDPNFNQHVVRRHQIDFGLCTRLEIGCAALADAVAVALTPGRPFEQTK